MTGHSVRNPPVVRLLGAALCLVLVTCAPAEPEPYNVLFIAVDDLRPQLGAYGEDYMVTPNLDRLAAEGRLFTHHYVQVPTCGASRYSVLTGSRPSSRAHLSNQAIRDLLPREESARPESFAHSFRRAGYHTVSIGKISHQPDGRVYAYDGSGNGDLEMPFSWDEVLMPYDKWGTAWNAFFGYADGSNRNERRGEFPAYERADVPDDAYPDGLIADAAIGKLKEVSAQPFLMAVGFFKPHLPFTAPAKYWDLYDRNALPPAPNPSVPEGGDGRGLHDSGEMFGNYRHLENGGAGVQVSDECATTLRHAYFASVSYVDAQIGRVLDELDRLDLRERTIVVVWGDHGWHLGDQTLWGKHSTFERAVRSALLVRTPGMNSPGTETDGLVESVDIYPTLMELASLAGPDSLAGRSFVRLLEDPEAAGKAGALSYWTGRRSLRTDRYRLTEYTDPDRPGVELFDYVADPEETRNHAAAAPEVVARLRNMLHELDGPPG